jgi:hypothetical protein
MIDDPNDIPLYVMAAPPWGSVMKNKAGELVRVHMMYVQGADIEVIKEMYFRSYDRELSDENALILQRGGMLKVEYDGDE